MAESFSEQNKDYGLPKVDPQLINREQPGIAKEVAKPTPRPEKKDNKLLVAILSVVGVLIIASIFYMIFWNDDSSEVENANPISKVEDRAVLDQANPESPDSDVNEPTENPAETLEATTLSEEPGSITTISQRTNRYFIFLGSYKFKAYAQRHAEKLAKDGFAVKLIMPDNWVGIRVAVGNYAKEEEAKVDAQQIRSRYGNEVVISRY